MSTKTTLKGFEVDISLPRSRWRDKPITMRVESGVKLHDAHATPSRRMGPRCRFWFPGDDLLDPEGGLYDFDDLFSRLRWAYPSALGTPFEQQVRELRIDDALCRCMVSAGLCAGGDPPRWMWFDVDSSDDVGQEPTGSFVLTGNDGIVVGNVNRLDSVRVLRGDDAVTWVRLRSKVLKARREKKKRGAR